MAALLKLILPRFSGFFSAFLLAIAGLVITIGVFGRGIDNYLVSDDWIFLERVASGVTASDIYGFFSFQTKWFVRPTQWLVTWGIYSIAGVNPAAYHLFSLALHLLNVTLLGLLLWRVLTLCFTRSWGAVLTVAACVLFATDQSHHESVFWFSSINELLAAFFRLLVLLLVWIGLTTVRVRVKSAIFTVAWFAFLLALISKESAVALPLEIALFYIIWARFAARRDDNVQGALLYLAPFALIVFVWGLVYWRTSSIELGGASFQRAGLRLVSPAEAPIEDWVFRFFQYVVAHFRGIRRFAFTGWGVAFQSVILVVLVIWALRGKRWLWLFAFAWFSLALTPYIFSVSVDAIDKFQTPLRSIGVGGDRYLYYSSAPFNLLVVLTLAWGGKTISDLFGQSFLDLRRIVMVLVLSIAFINSTVLVLHETEWDAAGQLAHETLLRAEDAIDAAAPNETICLLQVTDNVSGKFVFRNGLHSALKILRERNDVIVLTDVLPENEFEQDSTFDVDQCSRKLLMPTAASFLQK